MNEARLEPWRAYLERFDATLVPGPRPAWRVVVRGVETTLELVYDGVHTAPVRVSMALPPRMGALTIVARERALHTKGRVSTGAAAFDDAVVVHAPDDAIYGVFDEAGRALIARLVAVGVYASGGALVLEPWAASALEGDQVALTLDEMTALAVMLSQSPDELLFGIARVLETDTNRSVIAVYQRTFGGAAEVREARDKLKTEGLGFGTQERLELLAGQARDRNLGLSMRREAYERLLVEFRLARVESLFDDVPPALRPVLVPRVVALVKLEAGSAPGRDLPTDRAAGVRVLLALMRGHEPDDGLAREVVQALAALGQPAALPFLARCAARGVAGAEALGDAAIAALFRMDAPIDAIAAALGSDAVRAHVLERAPQALWRNPGALGPRFVDLFARAPVAARGRYLESLALAHAHLRNNARPHPDRGAHRELALDQLGGEWIGIQAGALSVLGELGEAADLPRIGSFTSGFFRAGQVKDAAKRAITEIRERLNLPEDGGGLALADHAAGGLSTPDDPS